MLKKKPFILRVLFTTFLAVLLTSVGQKAYSQNIGVNGTGNNPDASAMLHVEADKKGLIIPRVTLDDTSNADPVTAVTPAEGLMIYNQTGTEPKGYYYWDDGKGQWIQVGTGAEDDDWTRDPAEGQMYPTNLGDSIGIGVQDPNAELDIRGRDVDLGSNRAAVKITDQSDGDTLYMDGDEISGGLGGNGTGDEKALYLQLDADEDLVLSAGSGNSNVGVGSAANYPSYKFDMTGGDARFMGSSVNHLLFTDHSTDRVGVGTDSPSERFHAVQDNSSGKNVVYGQALGGADLTPDVGVYGEGLNSGNTSGNPFNTGVKGYAEGAFTAGVVGMVDPSGSGGYGVYAYLGTSHPGSFSGPAALRADGDGNGHAGIFKNGNVGVGINGPNYQLDVNGDANFRDALRANGDAGNNGQVLTSTGAGIDWEDAGNLNDADWDRDATDGELYPSNIGDQVGIGTTTPGHDLEVTDADGDGTAQLQIGSAELLEDRGGNHLGTNSNLEVDENVFVHGDDDGAANNTEPTGKLDLSIDDDDTGFEVVDDGMMDVMSDNDTILRLTNTGGFGGSGFLFNPGDDDLDFQVEGDNEPYLIFGDAEDDQVGIGDDFPSWDLEVDDADGNGTAEVAADAFVNTSDRKAKKDISDLEYGLKEVMQLEPVSFSYKKADERKKKHLGFVAQQVRPIMDEVIFSKKAVLDQESGEKKIVQRDTLGMDYTKVIPVLVNAIQKQQKQIDQENSSKKELKQKVQKLQKENQKFEERLQRIEEKVGIDNGSQ